MGNFLFLVFPHVTLFNFIIILFNLGSFSNLLHFGWVATSTTEPVKKLGSPTPANYAAATAISLFKRQRKFEVKPQHSSSFENDSRNAISSLSPFKPQECILNVNDDDAKLSLYDNWPIHWSLWMQRPRWSNPSSEWLLKVLTTNSLTKVAH